MKSRDDHVTAKQRQNSRIHDDDNARASTIVLRFSLRATSYEEQHLQIYQVLRHQTN